MIERSNASKLIYLPVNSFIQNVASRAPVPGGGSVAALEGSVGAGLYVMVCRLSVSRVDDTHADYFRSLTKSGMELRDRLRDLVDADSQAYEEVIEAAKLPEETSEEVAKKAKVVAEANKKAAEAPLATAKACLQGLEWGEELAQKCFDGAITDVGVAAQSLLTGFMGARLNVLVNLAGMEDAEVKDEMRSFLDESRPKAHKLAEAVLEVVERRLQS